MKTRLLSVDPSVGIPPDFPDAAELAVLRGWHAGLSTREAIERYLGERRAPGQFSRGELGRIRRQLATFARRRQREDLAVLFEIPAAKRTQQGRAADQAIELLRTLRLPEPAISDDVALWLDVRAVAALRAAGIDTLADLTVRVPRRRRWWATIPRIGQASARRIEAFFAEHPRLTERARALITEQARGVVVPWEQLRLPHEVDGSQGQFRAPRETCVLTADNDYEAAASSQQALPLAANEAFDPIDKALDPSQDGHYASNVNGQDTQQPVDKFGQPLLVAESPSSIALTSQATTTVYAGRHLHGTVQADWHLAAGNVVAAAAAKGVSLFAQRNGIRAIAEGGPVSIQAHTDALAVLADKAVTVTSSADSVEILAQQNIVLHGGDSMIRLEGNAITFETSGLLSVKGAGHPLIGPGGQAAALPALPIGALAEPTHFIELNHHYDDLEPVKGAPYKLHFSDGTTISGKVDGNGFARHEGVALLDQPTEHGTQHRQGIRDRVRRQPVREWSPFNGRAWAGWADPAFPRCRSAQEAPVSNRILGGERRQRSTAFDDCPQNQALRFLAVRPLGGR